MKKVIFQQMQEDYKLFASDLLKEWNNFFNASETIRVSMSWTMPDEEYTLIFIGSIKEKITPELVKSIQSQLNRIDDQLTEPIISVEPLMNTITIYSHYEL